jgi:hypothetical protein
MDAAIVGAAVFAAALVMFGTLRNRIAELERTVTRLQGRLDDLARRPVATPHASPLQPPQPAAAASKPIDIEPFVE